MSEDWKGHVFTTAGFHDDATCDNCSIGWLMFVKNPQPCPKAEAQSQAIQHVREILVINIMVDNMLPVCYYQGEIS